MHNFCTIATPDYLPFVQTLFASLKSTGKLFQLHVLVLTNATLPVIEGIKWYQPKDLEGNENVKAVFQKYQNESKVRWALKPFFLLHLLQDEDSVIYLDNDIFFFSRFDFLFNELQNHSLLLIPHWSSFEPLPYTENFLTSYQIGLFNAGFIGATKTGKKTLEWWGRLCLFRMEKEPYQGLYDDQKYLDQSLIYDSQVGILRHPGCNITSVNMHQNKRVKKGNEVLILDKHPVVFIHFSAETVKHILNGNDGSLKIYYDEYAKVFSQTGYKLSEFKHEIKQVSFAVNFKKKLKLRTRLKQFVFRVYQKL